MTEAIGAFLLLLGGASIGVALTYQLVDESWVEWAIKHEKARYNPKTGILEIDEPPEQDSSEQSPAEQK